jgi:hypothetical protein
MDSLADVISFGLAPAVLAFAWGVQFIEPWLDEFGSDLGRWHWWSCTVYREQAAASLLGLALRETDRDAGFLWAEYGERVRRRYFRRTASEQRLDEACRKILWANAIVHAGSGRYPSALPPKIDGNRLKLFRDPCIVDASEYQHVITTGSNGADFIFFMREHYCFENDSVGVGDGHEVIVRPKAKRKPVLRAPYRAQDHTDVNTGSER